MDDNLTNVMAYTTLPRTRKSNTTLSTDHMDIERQLASLNIADKPVPPPRVKKLQKKLTTLPNDAKYDSKILQIPDYSKYEVIRQVRKKVNTCDIIESSQENFRKKTSQQPDILNGSYREDINSKNYHQVETQSGEGTESNESRFMFYRPRHTMMHEYSHPTEQHSGLYYNPNPEESAEPARLYDKLHPAEAEGNHLKPPKPKPILLPSKTVYSTTGSQYTARACESPTLASQPKSDLRVHPSPIKPLLSAQNLESSLKQFSAFRPPTSKTTNKPSLGMCSNDTYENMIKYYNISTPIDSSTPSTSKLSQKKKSQSPYSSTSSLNTSAESVDLMMRRKKKIKIRPLSFSSDDESAKRISLEINLRTSEKEVQTSDVESRNKRSIQYQEENRTINQSVERLNLEDLTSTETAKYLKKQFTKLKSKANALKSKDNELKLKFDQLQSKKGKVLGHGGISKAKGRMSPSII